MLWRAAFGDFPEGRLMPWQVCQSSVWSVLCPGSSVVEEKSLLWPDLGANDEDDCNIFRHSRSFTIDVLLIFVALITWCSPFTQFFFMEFWLCRYWQCSFTHHLHQATMQQQQRRHLSLTTLLYQASEPFFTKHPFWQAWKKYLMFCCKAKILVLVDSQPLD